jgi:hypothetical protein
LRIAPLGISQSEDQAPQLPLKGFIIKEDVMHLHLCSECNAVITVDQGRECPSKRDHEDGLCEACAQAQAGSDEIV